MAPSTSTGYARPAGRSQEREPLRDRPGTLLRNRSRFAPSVGMSAPPGLYRGRHRGAIDCSIHGWQDFTKLSSSASNTHPKKATDLQMSTQDYATVRAAAVWCTQNIRKLIQSMNLELVQEENA